MQHNREEIEDSLEFCRDIKQFYPSIEAIAGNDKDIGSSLSQSAKISTTVTESFLSMEESEDEIPKRKSQKMYQEIIGFACYLLLAFVLAKLFTSFVGHHTVVRGVSMENTLYNNDVLLVDRLTYLLHEPSRYEIVIFPYEKNTYYIKRIVGLPGETIQIDDSKIYINGIALNDTYAKETNFQPGYAAEPILLAEDEYFVLGDNRNNSKDSRSPSVGVLKEKQLKGRAFFRIFPFNRIGNLE